MSSTHVLVVDDALVVCGVVQRLLRQCGLSDIELVQSGADALARLAARKFDIIICDWEMPAMNGLDVLVRVRSRADLRGIPFILMSARRDPQWVAEATRLGANSMMVKPFDGAALREKLRQLGFPVKQVQDFSKSEEPKTSPAISDAEDVFLIDT